MKQTFIDCNLPVNSTSKNARLHNCLNLIPRFLKDILLILTGFVHSGNLKSWNASSYIFLLVSPSSADETYFFTASYPTQLVPKIKPLSEQPLYVTQALKVRLRPTLTHRRPASAAWCCWHGAPWQSWRTRSCWSRRRARAPRPGPWWTCRAPAAAGLRAGPSAGTSRWSPRPAWPAATASWSAGKRPDITCNSRALGYLHWVERVHYAMLHNPGDGSGAHVSQDVPGRERLVVLGVHGGAGLSVVSRCQFGFLVVVTKI